MGNTGFRRPKAARAAFGSLSTVVEGLSCDGQSVLLTVASDLYCSLNTAVSLSCEILLRYGQLDDLVKKTINPLDYLDPLHFRSDAQSVSFLKKVPFQIPGIDPEGASKKKFYEAEEQCLITNRRIRNFLTLPFLAKSEYQRSFSIVVRKIQEVLGSFSASEWQNSCHFGPGSFNGPGTSGLTSHYDKLQVNPSCTKDMAELGSLLVMSAPPWARSVTGIEDERFYPFIEKTELTLIPGNKVAFVPKTAIVHRAIAIEPLLNIYSQLGIGSMIRRRLKKHAGLDLSDQTLNQRLAKIGSIDGSLATIDLSSASDTVAKGLVQAIIPDSWFHAMDLTRSKVGFIDKKWLLYEKFSSMGNGFTFELETLIFWAIACSACEISGIDTSSVSVYGDDIIVESSISDFLIELLEWYGFSTNKSKSYSSGVFRESCGKDYFDGIEVRPFFQKELPNEASSLFRLVNGLRRTSSRWCNYYGCDRRFRRPWLTAVSFFPKSVRESCRVPAHAGDSDGIISNWDEAQVSSFVIASRDGWEGTWGIRYQASPLVGPKESNFLGAVASLLYRLMDDDRLPEEYSKDTSRNWIVSELSSSGSSLASASPRQRRGCSYRLHDGAFYGPWTQLGDWY